MLMKQDVVAKLDNELAVLDTLQHGWNIVYVKWDLNCNVLNENGF